MVICAIALVTFSILGIFSVRWRRLAKEAFECVVRRVTLRPCTTKLDQRIRSKLTAKLLKGAPNLAKFVYKRFEILSWLFTILFLSSIFYSAYGLYNLFIFGTCEPHSTTCVFAPGEISCGSEQCVTEGCACETEGCEAPLFEACKGNCTCIEQVCG